MSWFNNMLGVGGFLGDLAGAIGNVVSQQQLVGLQRKQLELYQHAVDKELQLKDQSLHMSYELSTRGPALQYQSARELGFNHTEAMQMTGGARVSYGGVEVGPRTLPSLPFYNQGTNLLAQSRSIAAGFHQGLTGYTGPQPTGFGNPNYQPRLIGYRQNLDHHPGESNV